MIDMDMFLLSKKVSGHAEQTQTHDVSLNMRTHIQCCHLGRQGRVGKNAASKAMYIQYKA